MFTKKSTNDGDGMDSENATDAGKEKKPALVIAIGMTKKRKPVGKHSLAGFREKK